MASLSANPKDLKRKSMKKRLSLWDSFFSKVQDEFVNSTANSSDPESCEIVVLEDPQLASVNEAHNNLRRSLRAEHGINEESEISESEAEGFSENCDQVTDTDNVAGEVVSESDAEVFHDNSDSESILRKEELSKKRGTGKVGSRRNTVPKDLINKANPIKKPSDKILDSPKDKTDLKGNDINKSSKNKTDLKGNDINKSSKNKTDLKGNDINKSSKNKTDLKGNDINKSKDDSFFKTGIPKGTLGKDTTVEDCSELKIRKGKVVGESISSPKNKQENKLYECSTPIHITQEKRPPLLLPFITPIEKTREKRLPEEPIFKIPVANRKNSESPSIKSVPDKQSRNKGVTQAKGFPEAPRTAESKIDSNMQQPPSPQNTSPDQDVTSPQNRKLNLKEMCKQYDLWKLHQRRKSGRLGSVYIVSDLNEDLSDENRLVYDVPPVVKNPFKTPRRFSLQKQF